MRRDAGERDNLGMSPKRIGLIGDFNPKVIAHQAIPQSQLIIVQGAGHMTPMEQPEQVNHALRDFVAKMRET